MEQRKLNNGFTALENLKICIAEGTANETTFEVAIADEGLTTEIISLIKTYYLSFDIDLLAWKIYEGLKEKEAGIGNASVKIIKDVLYKYQKEGDNN